MNHPSGRVPWQGAVLQGLPRQLLLRVALFAAGLLLLVAAWLASQARVQALAVLPSTAALAAELLGRDASFRPGEFDRARLRVDVAALAPLGQRIGFCIQVEDLHGHPLAQGCLAPGEPGMAARGLGAVLRAAGRPGGTMPDGHAVPLVREGGIKVGEIRVRPYWAAEASLLLERWSLLAAVALAMAGLAVVVVEPVRRALHPAGEIQRALARMEAGELDVRLPDFELPELHRIGQLLNRLAGALARALAEQRALSQRLLEVREEERRHLARELHDEMGQCLAALRAEAAFAGMLAQQQLPVLRPSLQAVADTAARMHASLQRILRGLRPEALDEFGLRRSLQQLVDAARRRPDGAEVQARLQADAALDGLPPATAVQIYRIVQEGLTNALRHGGAGRVDVELARGADGLCLSVQDDGEGAGAQGPQPGHGLLGMRERVLGLGGSLRLLPLVPRGLRLEVRLPSAVCGLKEARS